MKLGYVFLTVSALAFAVFILPSASYAANGDDCSGTKKKENVTKARCETMEEDFELACPSKNVDCEWTANSGAGAEDMDSLMLSFDDSGVEDILAGPPKPKKGTCSCTFSDKKPKEGGGAPAK